MDLREKKTKRSIRNAFLELRSKKPLERISIKELAEKAEISKATFYLHYRDIYDLSDQMQQEVINSIVAQISEPDLFLSDVCRFHEELTQSFSSHQALIDILFSGNQAAVLPFSIERILKDHMIKMMPEKKNDVRLQVLLTYSILGAFFAYHNNIREFGREKVSEVLKEAAMMWKF